VKYDPLFHSDTTIKIGLQKQVMSYVCALGHTYSVLKGSLSIWQSAVERNKKQQEDQAEAGEESQTSHDEMDDNDEEPFFQHDG